MSIKLTLIKAKAALRTIKSCKTTYYDYLLMKQKLRTYPYLVANNYSMIILSVNTLFLPPIFIM